MNLTSIIVGIIVCALVLVIVFWSFPLCNTNGNSMLPTYKDSSILLATRLFNRENLKIGQVYVYERQSEDGEKYLVVKRLTGIHPIVPYLVYFEGDNPTESYDSRQYGFINAETIVAKVLWKVKH